MYTSIHLIHSSFSTTEGNEKIPALAKSYGLTTLVGAWLSDDLEQNEKEIQGLIDLCQQGLVDIAAVGNEVMYRKELTEEQLIEYIKKFKAAVPDIPTGYVDAYYEFSSRPNITAACDVILANCYPYWEGCHIDYSLVYMKQMYHHAKDVGQGKKVIITETGWPSQGSNLGAAQPSYENALQYFINAQLWAKKKESKCTIFQLLMSHGKLAQKEMLVLFGACGTKMKTLSLVYNIF